MAFELPCEYCQSRFLSQRGHEEATHAGGYTVTTDQIWLVQAAAQQLAHTGSPVFIDLFMTAADDRAAAASANKADSLCVSMTGHTLRDTCAALKFLYQRSMGSPSKQLWKSVAAARPIIKFAHKFDMKGILKECDNCLSEKAQEAGGHGVHMFSDNEAVIAWAALAEEFDLSNLLATAEVHMVKTLDPTFWQSKSFAAHKLSQACFLRLLQGAQYHAINSARIHKIQQQKSNPAESFFTKCQSNNLNGAQGVHDNERETDHLGQMTQPWAYRPRAFLVFPCLASMVAQAQIASAKHQVNNGILICTSDDTQWQLTGHLKLSLLLLKLCPASVEAGAAPALGMALLEDFTSPGFMAPEGLHIGKALIAQQGTRICSPQPQ
ncbi:MAG: hypothetical protein FRX49_07237 [Trebouxia sp. A1-2]|nr:MAG: hypothetical protein FRX49_07237 [Trebouxia sp. A1-2]